MNYWLLKTESSVYGFSDLVRDRKTRWDGITNPVALKNLRSAKAGDVAVVYHTGGEKQAVGLARIEGGSYPDPKNDRLAVVDISVDRPLKYPVTLATLKAQEIFQDSPLVRQGRLSFVPLTRAQFEKLMQLSTALPE